MIRNVTRDSDPGWSVGGIVTFLILGLVTLGTMWHIEGVHLCEAGPVHLTIFLLIDRSLILGTAQRGIPTELGPDGGRRMQTCVVVVIDTRQLNSR